MIGYGEASNRETGRGDYFFVVQLVLIGLMVALMIKAPAVLADNAYLNQLMSGMGILVLAMLSVCSVLVMTAINLCYERTRGPYLFHTLESYTGRTVRTLVTIPAMILILAFKGGAVSNEVYRNIEEIAFANGMGVLLIANNTLTVIGLLYALQDTKSEKQ